MNLLKRFVLILISVLFLSSLTWLGGCAAERQEPDQVESLNSQGEQDLASNLLAENIEITSGATPDIEIESCEVS